MEFSNDRLNVLSGCYVSDVQFITDFMICQPIAHQFENIKLSAGEKIALPQSSRVEYMMDQWIDVIDSVSDGVEYMVDREGFKSAVR